MPGDDLWSHPVRCANHRVSIRPVCGDLSTEAKVRHFDLAVVTKQNIVRLYVTMNYLLQMKKITNQLNSIS